MTAATAAALSPLDIAIRIGSQGHLYMYSLPARKVAITAEPVAAIEREEDCKWLLPADDSFVAMFSDWEPAEDPAHPGRKVYRA